MLQSILTFFLHMAHEKSAHNRVKTTLEWSIEACTVSKCFLFTSEHLVIIYIQLKVM